MLIGLAFGGLFPILAIFVDCYVLHDDELTYTVLLNLVNENPVHYIILTAPLILGITFLFIGTYYSQQFQLNQKLEESNRILTQSNEMLDTFSHHVSHDLKAVFNNLQALNQLVEKYLAQQKLDKVKEISAMMQRVVNNGANMIQNILTLSKSGLIFTDKSLDTVYFKKILHDLLELNGLNESIVIEYGDVQSEVLNIHQVVLESILLNIVTNAIKYNDNDQPKLTIDLTIEDGFHKLSCLDNGVGIDLKKFGQDLFTPFKRGPNSVGKDGSGIGLYLIEKLVKAYSGNIKVESNLRKGTRFNIFLPLNE